jgi:hypothetical protein
MVEGGDKVWIVSQYGGFWGVYSSKGIAEDFIKHMKKLINAQHGWGVIEYELDSGKRIEDLIDD